ncbi:MAG: DUF1501 domain-containing protein [Parvularcula sp.]|jgi:uncharacterized protein (DUF1501 family)|nr:DUF1501 domain-containing protein [Parvularcula sp.]
MHISRSSEVTRRTLLQRTGALSLAGAASSYALGLAGLGELAAQTASTDYKALVCVFLLGGNDHANTLIPSDGANYTRYSAARGGADGVAIDRESLSATVLRHPEEQTLTDDLSYALAPSMPQLAKRFLEGKMAPLLNVGPLVAPLTRQQFEHANTRAYPRPSKLFSHNDQQSTWQSFQPEGSTIGWGGKLADIAMSSNQNSMFTAIGIDGNSVFLNGEHATAFSTSASGPIRMYPVIGNLFGSKHASDVLSNLLRQQYDHVLENDYAVANSRSIEYSGFVADRLKNAPPATQFSGGALSEKLSTVAKLIAARHDLGTSRQVFFVSMGGFDTHSNLKGKHGGLLAEVDTAMDQFYSAMAKIKVADQVTTFTASDFGRTLTSNGNGSDHGWGGHHFILGGGVKGGRFYGTAPQVSTQTDDQVGNGRLLPSTSVDEYASTLALWLGVSPGDLSYVAPNIGRFANPDLGFMNVDRST